MNREEIFKVPFHHYSDYHGNTRKQLNEICYSKHEKLNVEYSCCKPSYVPKLDDRPLYKSCRYCYDDRRRSYISYVIRSKNQYCFPKHPPTRHVIKYSPNHEILTSYSAKHLPSHQFESFCSCVTCQKNEIRFKNSIRYPITGYRVKSYERDISTYKSLKMLINNEEKIELIQQDKIERKIDEEKKVLDKKYECKFCNKRFGKSSHLRDHHRTHSGEKPYICKSCNKGFSQYSNLRTHIRIHTGEKPYRCKYCEKSFTQKVTLRSHLRTHQTDSTFHNKQIQKGI